MASSSNSKPSLEENLAAAVKLKDDGNQFFKEGNIKAAQAKYAQMIMHLLGNEDGNMLNQLLGQPENSAKRVSTANSQQLKDLKFACHSNLGLCNLKLGNWDKAITQCTKALAIEANNVKALYRRGRAYLEKNDLDRAKADLRKAAELEPTDANIRVELDRLKEKFKDHDKKHKKVMQAMLQGLSCSDTPAGPSGETSQEPSGEPSGAVAAAMDVSSV